MEKNGEIRADITPPETEEKKAASKDDLAVLADHPTTRIADFVKTIMAK